MEILSHIFKVLVQHVSSRGSPLKSSGSVSGSIPYSILPVRSGQRDSCPAQPAGRAVVQLRKGGNQVQLCWCCRPWQFSGPVLMTMTNV